MHSGFILNIKSGAKTWKFTSNFLNTEDFWHVKGMNIPSEKMFSYKHGCVQNRVFMTSQGLNYYVAELAIVVHLINRRS